MEIPKKMTLSGKIRNKKLKQIFSDPTAKKLWCAISSCHLRSQYFNDEIINASKELKKIDLNDYSKFRNVVIRYLNSYGLEEDSGKPYTPFWESRSQVMDERFWHQVHDILTGKRDFNVKEK